MKLFKKRFAWAITYGIVLLAFTVYAALDTFVIARTYEVVEETSKAVTTTTTTSVAQTTAQSAATTSAATTTTSSLAATTTASTGTVITSDSYSDGNITITITKYVFTHCKFSPHIQARLKVPYLFWS